MNKIIILAMLGLSLTGCQTQLKGHTAYCISVLGSAQIPNPVYNSERRSVALEDGTAEVAFDNCVLVKTGE